MPIDSFKPLLVAIVAFGGSLFFDSVENTADTITLVGKVLTGITMIVTSIYTLIKLYKSWQTRNQTKNGKA